MRQILRAAAPTAAVAAVLAAAALVSPPAQPETVLTGSGSNSANSGCNGKNNPSCTPATPGPVKSFGVTVTDIGGMYPTRVEALQISFTNPHSFDIVVKTVQVTVSNANSDCSQIYLQRPEGVRTLATPIVVPRNGTAPGPSGAQAMDVKLLNSAPDACQGATFPITVTATAVQR